MIAVVFAAAAGVLRAAIGGACGYIGGRRDGRAERSRLEAEVEAHTGEHPLPHLSGEHPIFVPGKVPVQRTTSSEVPAVLYDFDDSSSIPDGAA